MGVGAALKRPDLFHAYVGIGQVINVRDNERISFDYGLAQARQHGNAEAIAELESIAPYPGDQPITRERIIIARKWPQYYGGMSAYRDGSAKYFFGAARLSPEYDAADAKAIDAGNVFTLGRILPEFLDAVMVGGERPLEVELQRVALEDEPSERELVALVRELADVDEAVSGEAARRRAKGREDPVFRQFVVVRRLESDSVAQERGVEARFQLTRYLRFEIGVPDV